jgi:hypothetical protein
MTPHLKTCAPRHDLPRGPTSVVFHLRVEGSDEPTYWLDLELKADAKLRRLDDFLRRIWLECCGHLGEFSIAGYDYVVSLDREFGIASNERNMNVRVGDVLAPGIRRFQYRYDFGSATELSLRVRGMREGMIGRAPVRLLARNDPRVWLCGKCQDAATVVCAYCIQNGEPFFCDMHAQEHENECPEEAPFLPVVNSPRMGVCGYTGEL